MERIKIFKFDSLDEEHIEFIINRWLRDNNNTIEITQRLQSAMLTKGIGATNILIITIFFKDN